MAHEGIPMALGHGYATYPLVAGRPVWRPGFEILWFPLNDMVLKVPFPTIAVKLVVDGSLVIHWSQG